MQMLKNQFTSVESFVLFYEGLRALQQFRDRNDLALLDEATARFGQGAKAFPQDALLAYYCGSCKLTQSNRAQDEARLQNRAPSAEALAQQQEAVRCFQQLRDHGPATLRTMAIIGLLSAGETPECAGMPKRPDPGSWRGRLARLVSRIPTRAQREANAEAVQLDIAIIASKLANARSTIPVGDESRAQRARQLDQMRSKLTRLRDRIAWEHLTGHARTQLLADVDHTLGRLLLLQGHLDEAEAAFKDAQRLRPDWVLALRGQASTLQKKRDSETGDEAKRVLAERVQKLTDKCVALVHPRTQPTPSAGQWTFADAAENVVRSSPNPNAI